MDQKPSNSSDPMGRIFLFGALASLAAGTLFLADLWYVAYPILLVFFVYLGRRLSAYGDEHPELVRVVAYSDPQGPNRGWDPRTVEAARRRANGIE